MEIVVQKFGGTSVATKEAREFVYEKIIKAKEEGYQVVVIVSAMGRCGEPYATDTLLNLVNKENKREMDMIYSCGEIISASIIASTLTSRGYKAVSLTGQQAGIVTNCNYFDAKIEYIDTNRIKKYLNEGKIPIIAGSQGVSKSGDVTTLGRGGSDISAVVLGAELEAEKTLIYTDVDGVMTADPCKVKDAKLIEQISYESCCKLAEKGAKVVHPRAVKIAQKVKRTKLYVKSTFSNCIGTFITNVKDEKGIQSITKNNSDIADKSVVSIIGQNMSYENNQDIVKYLKGKKFEYINYKFKEQCISFIVDSKEADKIINNLHEFIIISKTKALRNLA